MKRHLFAAVIVFIAFPALSYDSFEHLWLGDEVELPFPKGYEQDYVNYPYTPVDNLIVLAMRKKDIAIKKLKPSYLVLPSKDESEQPIKVSFGEIVALAGDFLGRTDGSTIVLPHQSETVLMQRFSEAASYLFPYKNNPYYANGNLPFLQQLFRKELGNLQQVINQPGGIHRNLARSHTAFAKIWANVASDYGKSPYYTKLLANNLDHFQPDAPIAYSAGHATALEVAKLAYRSRSDMNEFIKLLNRAYALDAFACHFLSDSFSAGHIRTPRRELLDVKGAVAIDMGLLANAMHDEDAWVGLEVTNNTKRKWTAFGDSSYFDYKSLTSRWMIHQALQASVDEVWAAANTGEVPKFGLYAANQFIPFALPGQGLHPLVTKGVDGYELRKNYTNYHSTDYVHLTPSSGVFTFLRDSKNSYNKLSFYDYISSDQAFADGKYEIEVECFTTYDRNRFFGNKDYVALPDRIEAYYIDNNKKGFQNLKGNLKPSSRFYVVSEEQGREAVEYCVAATQGSTLVEVRGKGSKWIERNGLPLVLYDIYGDLYRVLGHEDAFFNADEIKEDIRLKLEGASH